MFTIAVLLSGSGTTLQNLIDRAADGSLPVRIAGVISSKQDAYGLRRAADARIPAASVDFREYKNPEFSRRITAQLDLWKPDLIVMAGFIHLYQLPPQYTGKIINVHPALLPKFGGKGMYGIRVHEAVLRAGERESGCTVHYVDEEYDHGSVILRRKVAIAPGETPDSLQRKVQAEERLALPEVIRRLAEK